MSCVDSLLKLKKQKVIFDFAQILFFDNSLTWLL